ncbi:septum formation protein [Fluviicoccus keumensis]|uniref:7-methyl-GTP pyrophosphatase n=1 Tax=Fluviicoccus keumensis TaxID=1435465 RepID=A0A4Q7Z422_9GAMM|nr:Maf family nucleotide pyrophosphatase [Fluviicoccus keumensis]RZU45037.1 septum formation protein [Fluviicoccus keumensis]
MTPALVLASTSRYRAELLQRLSLEFIQVQPEVEETPLPGESPHDVALRLAEAKARALATAYTDHLIIGSDQTAGCDLDIIGKPGSRDRAIGQLLRFSGRSIEFHTGLCLLNTRTGHCRTAVNTTTVTFRSLSEACAERYVDREQPLDCAGSFKAEGLGIALFSRIVSDDPTSLIGLPLITLTQFLLAEGWMLP